MSLIENFAFAGAVSPWVLSLYITRGSIPRNNVVNATSAACSSLRGSQIHNAAGCTSIFGRGIPGHHCNFLDRFHWDLPADRTRKFVVVVRAIEENIRGQLPLAVCRQSRAPYAQAGVGDIACEFHKLIRRGSGWVDLLYPPRDQRFDRQGLGIRRRITAINEVACTSPNAKLSRLQDPGAIITSRDAGGRVKPDTRTL
jgi:hypothetical protein